MIQSECYTGTFHCEVDFVPIKGGEGDPIKVVIPEKFIEELTKERKINISVIKGCKLNEI